ncbi:hypothetical protein STRA110950_02210 [Streptobacillus ratti]|uniref:hypothetical protein n=2 Tax=Streptobacillus ratti TaxID=1720557 RepID=UPI0039E9C444
MNQSFITSYLTFYMRASIYLEKNFIKTSNPNSILKLIPLGSTNKTIPLEQISSVDDSFKMDIKSFIWGLIFTFFGFSTLVNSSIVTGIILFVYGVLTVLSSFQVNLELSLNSGQVYNISVVIFEKPKLLVCKEVIESHISKRYDDTNVTTNTDRIIEVMNKK